MRVAVTGGRTYSDRKNIFRVLDLIHEKTPVELLVHGACDGADMVAQEWAMGRGVEVKAYRADWEKHGRAAGPIRNQRMLEEARPQILVVFPGARGTLDCATRARHLKIRIVDGKPGYRSSYNIAIGR